MLLIEHIYKRHPRCFYSAFFTLISRIHHSHSTNESSIKKPRESSVHGQSINVHNSRTRLLANSKQHKICRLKVRGRSISVGYTKITRKKAWSHFTSLRQPRDKEDTHRSQIHLEDGIKINITDIDMSTFPLEIREHAPYKIVTAKNFTKSAFPI